VCAGYLYDLRLKGSPFSWLPFTMGIPLLPVFAWVGATGDLPPIFVVLLPLAGLAGSGLAIGNARADYERDLDAGTASVATRLGLARSWRLHAVIHLVVVLIALGAAVRMTGEGDRWVPIGTAAAGLVILAGVGLGRAGGPSRRELAWEVEAAGTGLLAVIWLLGVGGTR
jgi:4-hydroxybenzoate polyprenyltransferase